jgi:hypothetical protein
VLLSFSNRTIRVIHNIQCVPSRISNGKLKDSGNESWKSANSGYPTLEPIYNNDFGVLANAVLGGGGITAETILVHT